MPGGTRKAASPGPATVPVHDAGDVERSFGIRSHRS
jgi:hypothetical protein